jgi:UPF0042 nucleotide-binding protein
MVLDVRSRAFSTDLAGAIRRCGPGLPPAVVFVDADDDVLIRRFESVRRRTRCRATAGCADGIAASASCLARRAEQADVLQSTPATSTSTRLRGPVEEMFLPRRTPASCAVTGAVVRLQVRASHRTPDFVLDARFLPKPLLGAGAARHNGREPTSAGPCLGPRGCHHVPGERTPGLINATPGRLRAGRGKRYLTLPSAAPAASNRSVAIAEELATAAWGTGAAALGRSTADRAGMTAHPSGWWRSAGGHGLATALRALRGCGPTGRRPGPDDHRRRDGRRRRRLQRAAAHRAPALPPGDLRQALAALADATTRSHGRTAALFQHRFAAPTRSPAIRSATSCCAV